MLYVWLERPTVGSPHAYYCINICQCRFKAFKMDLCVALGVLLGLQTGVTIGVDMSQQGLTVFPATSAVSPDPASVTELSYVL